jgi:hypothetical protein
MGVAFDQWGGAWKTCSQCDAYAAEGGIVGVLGMLCKDCTITVLSCACVTDCGMQNLEISWIVVRHICYANYVADAISNLPSFRSATFADEVVHPEPAT